MRTKWFAAIALGALILTVSSFGDEDSKTVAAPQGTNVSSDPASVSAESSGSLVGEVAAPSEEKFIGLIELRPTYGPQSGSWFTENTVKFGYQFRKNLSVSYTQYINTNIYSPFDNDTKGLEVFAHDGFFRMKMKNIWNSPDGTWSFGWQPRIYMPTHASKRDAGMVTIVRNYFDIKKQITDGFSITGTLLPIVHVYDKAGIITDGEAEANPLIENRIYLTADIDIVKNLTLSIPIMWHLTRYHDFQTGADDNSAWSNYLYVWPELVYDIDANFAVGLAYRSENLVRSDFGATDMGVGFEHGVWQAILKASL